MDPHAVVTEIQGMVARIWLNRPDSRNSLNMDMMEEFLISLKKINEDQRIRMIVLRGRGPSFCSGADLDWMQQASRLSWEDNYRESVIPARCFHELFVSPKITLAGVHGAAFGGAIGLITACDMAIAAETSVFAFSEVKLGLVPATIAPYVFQKANKTNVLEYMLTGRQFSGPDAERLGLVNRYVPDNNLEQALEDLISELLNTAPAAQLSVKKLFRSIATLTPDLSTIDQTASLLAETRVSNEAKEGIRAFLERRPPEWINTQ